MKVVGSHDIYIYNYIHMWDYCPNSLLTWFENYGHIVEAQYLVETLSTLQPFKQTGQNCSTQKELDSLNCFLYYGWKLPIASFQGFSVGCFNRIPDIFHKTVTWDLDLRRIFHLELQAFQAHWESYLAFSPALVVVTTSSHLTFYQDLRWQEWNFSNS